MSLSSDLINLTESTSKIVKRVSAILISDVAGYSRLMAADQDGTLAHYISVRDQVLVPSIQRHRGRVFKFVGDGILAEFNDASDALNCGLDIQDQVSSDRRLKFRIGINVDEVIADGEDVFGDGVNLAERLQSIAPVGHVAVSEAAKNATDKNLPVVFDDHGERVLRNFDRSVRVFVARRQQQLVTPSPSAAPADATSIAVLPFTNFGGDAEHEHFIDGLTEDIITDLSNVPGFFVIARNSSFAYKGRSVDVRQVARDLGVIFVLEGSARRSHDRLRVNLQLINAADNAKHIWAERFDSKITDIFEVQDEIAHRVVTALSTQLGRRAAAVPQQHPRSIEVYDLCLRARNMFAVSNEANEEAERVLSHVIGLQPDYAEAHWQLAMVKAFKWLQWGHPQVPNRADAVLAAEMAVKLNSQDSSAHWVLGYVLLNERRWDESESHYARAIDLNPNNADAYAPYANFMVLTGRPEQGERYAKEALRLNPFPPAWYYWSLGFAQVANGHLEEAIATLRRKETYRSVTKRILAAALALSGKHDEAAIEAQAFMTSAPGWRISEWLESQPFRHESDREFWRDAYRTAGLPD
jgi:adenylate cyclase